MVRVLLVYQFFGPYHVARFQHWCRAATEIGWQPLGLQLFGRPDLYDWNASADEHEYVSLGLATDGRDNLRIKDVHQLMRTFTELRPNVLIVNGWGMRDAVVAHLWSRLHGVPRVLVTDSQETDFKRGPVKEFLKREIIRGVGSAFVAGTPHRRYARKLGIASDRITDGCDVVDNDHFKAAIAMRKSGGHRLLTVARWSPEKNLLAAGQAFLSFVEQRPATESWRWSIAGYGPLEKELQTLARGSGGRIELLGSRRYQELPAAYADADLYWQPSIRDSWGLPVNEAMAAGLPVLVSNQCGCHEDLATLETGWIFDPSSVEEMTRALNNAARNRAKWPEMGKASSALIQGWGLARFTSGLMEAARLAMTP